ncbi:MAG: biotin--[acetyl-CoA-carboxylase] ligase [bacterium]|nr:biotin--[acetyl-CoA-carboxylase] ligase [bacterium]
MPLSPVIQRHKSLDSTNEEAKRIGLQGAPDGTIIVAEKQEQGRGREGRLWESPAVGNLYASIILRPALSMDQIPRLTVMTGVALARFLRKEIPLEVVLKWPNDIYYNGKKLGGILCEAEAKKDGALDFVVIGIGLNINANLKDFSPKIRKTATSLSIELKKRVATGLPLGTVRLERSLRGCPSTGPVFTPEKILNSFLPYFEEEYKKMPKESWEMLQKRFSILSVPF